VTIDPTAKAADPAASSKSDKLADPLGRDAFMNLLLTQLQHQDPTQPQADGEFLAQLAQFSALEQLQSMNSKLESMASFFNSVESAANVGATEGK
jgi:flagellar basal-body rod modification protein FlgD